MSFLKKLFVGKFTYRDRPRFNPIQRRILNIRSIWNNDHQADSGIEKLVRLFLSCSQLLFPGVYIKYIACKLGPEYQDVSMDAYVLLKMVFPWLILTQEWQSVDAVIVMMIYLLLETVLYIPTLIFASDLFTQPRSYKRSMLLLFFNYLELVVGFAVLYTLGNNMNKPFTHWFDPVYFSVVSANSIGFGDYHPITTYGKVLVSIQAMFFLSFVLLFLNFFSKRVKSKGYFEGE